MPELSRYQAQPVWVQQSSEFRCPYWMAFKASSGLDLVCLFSCGTQPEVVEPAEPCGYVKSLQTGAKVFQWICRT